MNVPIGRLSGTYYNPEASMTHIKGGRNYGELDDPQSVGDLFVSNSKSQNRSWPLPTPRVELY